MELSAQAVTAEEQTPAPRSIPWPRIAMLVLSLGLALVPAGLVFQERWLDDGRNRDMFQEGWCSITILCRTGLPSYFALVLACAGALLILLAALFPPLALAAPTSLPPAAPAGIAARIGGIALATVALGLLVVELGRTLSEQRLPGLAWAAALLLLLIAARLYEGQFASVWQRMRSIPAWAGPWCISLLALSGLLRSIPAEQAGMLLFGGVLALGLYGLQRVGAHPLAWITLLGLAGYGYAINGWWFAVIGDEYAFARLAGEIAQEHTLAQINRDVFHGLAVYGQHPYFSSLVQAFTVKLFGYDNFGWRFGATLLCTLSLPLFYYIYRSFSKRTVALIATFWLACSHYLMSFGKIGYNNLQAYFAMALGLATALWLVRSRRLSAAVACGLSLGLCLYLYPAAFYVLPVSVLLLVVCAKPLNRQALALGTVVLIVLLLALFPLMRQPEYWAAKQAGTLFNNPERTATAEALQTHLSNNFLYSLVSFLYLGDESHFVVVGYADPLSGMLIPLGALALALRFWQTRGHGFWAASFAGLIVMVGVSHDRLYPTPTRMFLLLPWFALFSALALEWLGEQLRDLGVHGKLVQRLGSVVLVAIVLLNLWQAYPLSFQRSFRYHVKQSLFLHAAQEILRSPRGRDLRFVFLNDPQTINLESFQELLDMYRVPYGPGQFVEYRLVGPQIDRVPEEVWGDPQSVLLINPELEASQRQQLIERAKASNRSPCSMRSSRDEERFVLWMPPGTAELCPS